MPFFNNISGKFGYGRPNVDKFGSIRFNSAQRQDIEVSMTAIGTSTATIELWFNVDANNVAQRLMSTSTINFMAGDFGIRLTGAAFVAGDGASGITSSTLPTAGVWNHVAWVGTSGTSQSLYLNGSRVGTGGAYNLTDTTFYIGGRNINTEFYNGYMSNIRYVRGTAVYTGTTYTVPTTVLYPIAGTELLLKTLYGPYFAQDYSPNNYGVFLSGTSSTPSANLLSPFS